MSDKDFYRKNSDLLLEAQDIFGKDVVVNAWTSTYFLEGISTLDDVENRLKRFDYKYKGNKEIDYGGEIILLEFFNGNKVMFSGSEWETITLFEGKLEEI